MDERSLSRWMGENIFLVPADTLIRKLHDFPEVKAVIVRKELPQKLTVEIQEYTLCAFLRENTKIAISKEGVLFPSKEKTSAISGYPSVIYERVSGKEDFRMGESLPGLKEAMGTYLSVKGVVPIDIIKVKKEKEIYLYTKNTKTEIRMDSENYEKEADYLKILMKELPSKNVEYIDLRFGEDIVVKP